MRLGAVITCECGFEARAADEEGLVAEVRRHAAEAHCMPLSHEEALLLTFHAELCQHGTVADSPRSAIPDSSNKTSNS
jgi:predicted small metal-binding protein